MRSVALLAVLSLVAPMAHADNASEAQLQYELGAELYSQRRYTEALERFLASNRLVPNANVVSNIAQIYALLERWVDAYNWYENYLAFELDAAARARGVSARDALLPRVAVVEVVSEPTGAALYVDRIELGSVGNAPRRVAMTPGAHTVFGRLEAHRDARADSVGVLGRVATASLVLEAIVGTLRVSSVPAGAQVFVEGRADALGTTPLEVQLPIGAARVTLRQREYAELTRLVQIEDSQTSTLELELEPLASGVSILSVMTQPAGAGVRVDGSAQGTAPLTLDRIEPGRHQIEIAHVGLETWRGELVLEAGSATRVTATLEDTSSIAFEDLRWIGYIGGGAALLASGCLGIAALLAHDAFYADPSRSQLDLVGTLDAGTDALLIAGAGLLALTLVLDLAFGPRPHSRARVHLDR